MRRTGPLTVRLPFTMADRKLRLDQVMATDRTRSRWERRFIVACFAMTRPEHRFAQQVLARKRNVWLFRCNQREFCGDFIAIDMSAASRSLRPVAVMELKSRARLSLGSDGGGIQLQNARAAVNEIAATTALVSPDPPLTLAYGENDLVLSWIEANGLSRAPATEESNR